MEAVFASSGTAKMLAMIAGAHGESGRTVSRESLDQLRQEGLLHRLVHHSDWLVPGLKPARRDLLLPGWTLMNAFMRIFDVPILDFSASALREGMLTTMRDHHVAPDRASINARMQWRDGTGD
jgi:exopolyphosphatase/pppGpp-phosphohydrolase